MQNSKTKAQIALWDLKRFFFIYAFAFAMLLSSFHAFFPLTSAWDEQSHLSYVQYAFNWRIPREGAPLNDWGMSAFSCHLHQFYGQMTGVPCGQLGLPAQYPAGGNTAAFWPPIYYFLVAVSMRLPLLVIEDPLFAARLSTALIWSLGIAWISLLLLKKTGKVMPALSFTFITVSLPIFVQYSSFVSPHAMNPILIATGLYLSDRAVADYDTNLQNRRALKLSGNAFTRNKWFLLISCYSAVCALVIPQSITFVVIFGVYILIRKVQKTLPTFSLSRSLRLGGISLLCTVLPFSLATIAWQFIHSIRKLDIPAIQESTNSGAEETQTKVNLFATVIDKFWDFWPGALQAEWPSGNVALFFQNTWFLIIVALAFGAILFWKKNNWLSSLMFAMLLVAPVFSIAFSMVFTFPVPKRYALGVAIVAFLAIANSRLTKPSTIALFSFAVFTYTASFLLDPLKVDITRCAGTGSEIICRILG